MADIHVYQRALREHAVELGINLDEDPEFYWIAEESLVAPLPEGWVQLKQVEGEYAGSLYYYNEITGESVWEHPCDQFYREKFEEEKAAKEAKAVHKSMIQDSQSDSHSEVIGEQMKKHDEEVSQLKAKLEVARENLSEKDTINESLRSEVVMMQKRIKRFEEKLSQKNKDQDESDSDLFALKAEIDRLKVVAEEDSIQIMNLKNVSEHLKKYKDRATTLKAEKKKNEDVMKEMHHELKMALETGETLHKELFDARNTVDHVKTKASSEVAKAEDKVLLAEEQLKKCLLDLKEARAAEVKALKASDEWQRKYMEERRLRRDLGKKLMTLQGNIFVICRVRPLMNEEKNQCVELIDSERLLVDEVPHTFDAVFGPQSSQEEVFAEVQPSALSVLEGFNVCIFAYGQTGSGKTYTMEGEAADRGVNYRALTSLFDQAQISPDISFVFTVSMLEVYNESVKDLIGGEENLDIRLGNNGTGKLSVYVEGLRECEVSSMVEVESLMAQGSRNRTVASNNVNEHSSRSHLVLCVKVAATRRGGSVTTFGKLSLIDLAGSERLKMTNAEGARLKEAQNINRSLSALGDVVSALGKPLKKDSHVPYRNSKLTYLLQDSLSAESRVLMFVNIGPSIAAAPESQCSLKFAGRCRAVQLGAVKKSVKTKN